MPYELCRHIKTNGKRCKSPAVTGKLCCYFHSGLHARHRRTTETKPVTSPVAVYMPVLEDRESVQVAISLVAGAIATGHLDDKRAASLIRILTLAIRNVGNPGDLITSPSVTDAVCAYLTNIDGNDYAPRQMDDYSAPPARPAAPPAKSAVS